MAFPKVVTLSTEDLIARLLAVETELKALGKAPRVVLDTDAILSLVQLSLRAITELAAKKSS